MKIYEIIHYEDMVAEASGKSTRVYVGKEDDARRLFESRGESFAHLRDITLPSLQPGECYSLRRCDTAEVLATARK